MTETRYGTITPDGLCTVRHAIGRCSDSISAPAKRYHLNSKTARTWKKRAFTYDAPTGPKRLRRATLTREQEALPVAFGGTRCCHLTTVSARCSRPLGN